MKSAIPFAFAAQPHADSVSDCYRNAPRHAEPEAIPEPARNRRLLRTLHLARTPC